jgi:hypothetical protein
LIGLRKKLITLTKLSEAYAKSEKSIIELIDSCITDLQKLRVLYNEHIHKHVTSYRRYEQLRQDLLSGEPMNISEITGDAIANMLKEIE